MARDAEATERVFGDHGEDPSGRFVHLKVDADESRNGRMVRRDGQRRQYWFKNGRNDWTGSQEGLEKYYAVVMEDKGGDFYVVKCRDILGHPKSRASRSGKHGDRNPHVQIPMRCVREIGQLVEPAEFVGLD